jgi:hypothetical protein
MTVRLGLAEQKNQNQWEFIIILRVSKHNLTLQVHLDTLIHVPQLWIIAHVPPVACNSRRPRHNP